MTDAALYRLLAWLSPGYPVGAFSYSHGLEHAVEAGHVRDAATALAWVEDLAARGGGFTDAVLLAAAWRAAAASHWAALRQVAELAAAFAPSAELALESQSQGRAFFETTQTAWPCEAFDRLRAEWDGPIAYPVAVGAAAAGHGVALEGAMVAYLHAFAANLVSALVRLVPLGQSDGQRITARLEPTVHAVAQEAARCPIEELGASVPLADICSMRHETQYTRLFRS